MIIESVKKYLARILRHEFVVRCLERLGFRDYDLPLDKSEDSQFLILLIGLMSFLAVLACSGIFALNGMTDRWSSGLENKVTIEIPAETQEGHLLSNRTIQKETKKLADGLKNHKAIKSVSVLSNAEIQDLISPWIGKGLTLDEIPLPGLVAIELNDSNEDVLQTLEHDIKAISKYANLETHHKWLSDLIRFANTLKMLSIFVAMTIAIVTITAIAAGMHTRLAIHKKEVKLLHAMGATDNYIARQFQRHAMILAFRGGIAGTIGGIVVTGFIVFLSTYSNTSLIPAIEIGGIALLFLCAIPIVASLIATLASRFTVLHSLAKMP